MSFALHTPEALLPRSDSKNPATTCKGITSNGRTCRRSLGSSPKSSPGPSPLKDRGVIAVLRDGQDDGNAAAAFYCWQHKDQGERVAETEKNHTELFPLQERTSIDTLVDRVGIMNLEEDTGLEQTHHKRRWRREGNSKLKTDLPADWQRIQGPLMSVPSDLMGHTAPTKPRRRRQPPRSNVKASPFCCIRDVGDDEHPAPRPRPHAEVHSARDRIGESRQNSALPVAQVRPSQTPSPISRKPIPCTPIHSSAVSPGSRTPDTLTRPTLAPIPQSTHSQTQALLSLIPPHLSPHTTSTLLTELSKPISPADASGYIYMFWLTPESAPSKPDDDAASDLLLDPPTTRPLPLDRRKNDVLQRYATQRRGPAQQTKTVLLKIGRAENVHRRLSQWSKQCSYNITLIRYYPYISSRTSPLPSPFTPPHSGPNPQALPRKVPHVHRVERLIHVELAEKRVTEQRACGECGRVHREWFEVEASREGLRGLDEVVRRWVAWGERLG